MSEDKIIQVSGFPGINTPHMQTDFFLVGVTEAGKVVMSTGDRNWTEVGPRVSDPVPAVEGGTPAPTPSHAQRIVEQIWDGQGDEVWDAMAPIKIAEHFYIAGALSVDPELHDSLEIAQQINLIKGSPPTTAPGGQVSDEKIKRVAEVLEVARINAASDEATAKVICEELAALSTTEEAVTDDQARDAERYRFIRKNVTARHLMDNMIIDHLVFAEDARPEERVDQVVDWGIAALSQEAEGE